MSAAAYFPTDTYWTLDQAAAALHKTPGGIRRACQKGQLPAVKIGREWRVLADEITQHCRRKPTPEALPDNVTSLRKRAG